MEKEKFIAYCAGQLEQVFIATKDGKPDLKRKHRSEGLLLAAELLGILDREEAARLIEKQHFSVFGETVTDRNKRKKTLQELKETSPDEYFEIPAIERRK